MPRARGPLSAHRSPWDGRKTCCLDELIRHGAFRKDLHYSLADLELTLPPLRERREDLCLLVDRVFSSLGAEVRLSRQAEAVLVGYPFPGNIRELQSVLKRAVALSRRAGVLEAVHFAHLLGEHDRDTLTSGSAPSDGGLVFSPDITALAARLSVEERPLAMPEKTRRERRALHRAALLCLDAELPRDA